MEIVRGVGDRQKVYAGEIRLLHAELGEDKRKVVEISQELFPGVIVQPHLEVLRLFEDALPECLVRFLS